MTPADRPPRPDDRGPDGRGRHTRRSTRWHRALTGLAVAAGIGAVGLGLATALVVPGPDDARATPATPPAAAAAPAAAAGQAADEAPDDVVARATPVAVLIPAIGVRSRLVDLGLQHDSTVEVPADPDHAGWYDLGPVPGETGSAVVLGHVDSAAGPAVFARLGELRPGAVVTVSLTDGRRVRFEVARVQTFVNDRFPAERVYGDRGRARLTLVTCGGEYDAARGGYQSNVVVWTRHRQPA